MKKLTIFLNHFEGKTTTVYGNWCNNGCQTFHKDDAEKVFDRFNVMGSRRIDVLGAFSDEEIDSNEVILSFLPASTLKLIIEKTDDLDLLKKIIDADRDLSKIEIARRNITELNQILAKDEYFYVRYKVAEFTTDKDILENLTKDEDSLVRYTAIDNYRKLFNENIQKSF